MKTFLALLAFAIAFYSLLVLLVWAFDRETCSRITREADLHLIGYYITRNEAEACIQQGLPVPNARVIR